MSVKPIALNLGSGPPMGSAVAKKLANNGYAVAMASRKGTGTRNDKGFLVFKADFSEPASVQTAFDGVRAELGASLRLVVYNAATLTPPPVPNSVFSIPVERVASNLNVNTVSPFAAAQLAMNEWATLLKNAAKDFIYTGSMWNVKQENIPSLVLHLHDFLSSCRSHSRRKRKSILLDHALKERWLERESQSLNLISSGHFREYPPHTNTTFVGRTASCITHSLPNHETVSIFLSATHSVLDRDVLSFSSKASNGIKHNSPRSST